MECDNTDNNTNINNNYATRTLHMICSYSALFGETAEAQWEKFT